jgi:hypothetical protein
MFKKLAIWYLKKCLKGLSNIEIVINKDFDTYRRRDFKREQSIKETLSKIK